jgi:hypothetical protein
LPVIPQQSAGGFVENGMVHMPELRRAMQECFVCRDKYAAE